MRAFLIMVVVATLGSSASAQAASTVFCRGVDKQNACRGQEICINDPKRLPEHTHLSLSLSDRSYSLGGTTGRIIAITIRAKGALNLNIDPPIFDKGRIIELSPRATTAQVFGSEYNYFFRCEPTNR